MTSSRYDLRLSAYTLAIFIFDYLGDIHRKSFFDRHGILLTVHFILEASAISVMLLDLVAGILQLKDITGDWRMPEMGLGFGTLAAAFELLAVLIDFPSDHTKLHILWIVGAALKFVGLVILCFFFRIWARCLKDVVLSTIDLLEKHEVWCASLRLKDSMRRLTLLDENAPPIQAVGKRVLLPHAGWMLLFLGHSLVIYEVEEEELVRSKVFVTYLTLVFFLLMVTNCWPDVASAEEAKPLNASNRSSFADLPPGSGLGSEAGRVYDDEIEEVATVHH